MSPNKTNVDHSVWIIDLYKPSGKRARSGNMRFVTEKETQNLRLRKDIHDDLAAPVFRFPLAMRGPTRLTSGGCPQGQDGSSGVARLSLARALRFLQLRTIVAQTIENDPSIFVSGG